MFTGSRLSIDLGASYTKIAYRPELDRTAHRVAGIGSRDEVFGVPTGVATFETQAEEQEMWVPSIVAHARETDRWFFGATAAELGQAQGVEPFVNWKRSLFLDPSSEKLRRVCGQFLAWVLERARRQFDFPQDVRVRVAVPALHGHVEFAGAIRASVAKLGLDLCFDSEPRCNAIGAFSQGRNGMWVPPPGRELVVSRGRTIGGRTTGGINDAIFDAMRRRHSSSGSPQFRAVLIDFGAFTCDVARIDLDLETDHLPAVGGQFKSDQIGLVQEVDTPVFAFIEGQHDFDAGEMSFERQERMKERVYAGESYAFPGGTLMETDKDRAYVGKILDRYVQRAWELVEPLLDDGDEQIIVTGGPIASPLIRQRLERLAATRGIALYVPGVIETSHVVPSGIDAESLKPDPLTRAFDGWRVRLDRLATALGGACCLMDVGDTGTGSGSDPIRSPSPA